MEKIFNRIRRFRLTKNAPQKILSVIVAVVLWLIILDYENPEMNKTFNAVPIDYIAEERLELNKLHSETPLDQTIDITVRGRRKNVLSLKQSDLSAHVDMSNLSSGTVELPITVNTKSDTVAIINTNKTSIRVVLDDIITRELAVKHFAEGELQQPYIVLKRDITPSSITVTGPKKIVDTIDRAIIPYSLAEADSSFTFIDELVILDKDGQIIDNLALSSKRIKVAMTIGKIVDLPIRYRYQDPSDEQLKIINRDEAVKQVKVRGSIERLRLVEQVDSDVIVVPEAAGSHVLEVGLSPPEGLTIIAPQSVSVNLTTDFLDKKNIQLTAANIAFDNQPSDRQVRLADDNFTLALDVTGYRSIWERTPVSSLRVAVDLNNLADGEHTVRYAVQLPDELVALDPSRLTGELKVVIEAPTE